MASLAPSFGHLSNPIDTVEKIAALRDWAVERCGDEELTLSVAGTWSDYHVTLHWREDLDTLHFACAFDLKVPKHRLPEIYKLLAKINEQLWIGHFDLWLNEGLLMFRHGLMLQDAAATAPQCEALLQAGLEACERYYQSFQFVVWAGKSAEDSMASAMFEAEGQA